MGTLKTILKWAAVIAVGLVLALFVIDGWDEKSDMALRIVGPLCIVAWLAYYLALTKLDEMERAASNRANVLYEKMNSIRERLHAIDMQLEKLNARDDPL